MIKNNTSRALDAGDCFRKSGICIEQISQPGTLSEGPHWDVDQQVLYFVDIPKQTLFCYDPATGNVTKAYISEFSWIYPIKKLGND